MCVTVAPTVPLTGINSPFYTTCEPRDLVSAKICCFCRQYSMTRNFERLRSLTNEKRLSRRFGNMERSNTIWSDMVMETGLNLGMQMRRSHTRPENAFVSNHLSHSSTYEDDLNQNHVTTSSTSTTSQFHHSNHQSTRSVNHHSGGGVHITHSDYNISSRQVISGSFKTYNMILRVCCLCFFSGELLQVLGRREGRFEITNVYYGPRQISMQKVTRKSYFSVWSCDGCRGFLQKLKVLTCIFVAVIFGQFFVILRHSFETHTIKLNTFSTFR